MKRMITSSKDRAKRILALFDPEVVDYVREYKDEIDSLTVVEPEGDDWIEVDPSDEISKIERRYVRFGIDEGLLDGYEDLETIYEALCTLEDDE